MVKSPLSCVRDSKIVISREKEEEEKGERGKRGFACYFGGKQWRSLKLEKLAKRKTAILPCMFSHVLKTLRVTFQSGAAAQTRDPTILKRPGIIVWSLNSSFLVRSDPSLSPESYRVLSIHGHEII